MKAKSRRRTYYDNCFWCSDGKIINKKCTNCTANYGFVDVKRRKDVNSLPKVKEVLSTHSAKDRR